MLSFGHGMTLRKWTTLRGQSRSACTQRDVKLILYFFPFSLARLSRTAVLWFSIPYAIVVISLILWNVSVLAKLEPHNVIYHNRVRCLWDIL